MSDFFQLGLTLNRAYLLFSLTLNFPSRKFREICTKIYAKTSNFSRGLFYKLHIS